MASPEPVLPDVGSTIVPPGFNKPSRSAASIIATATRSLTLPPGFVVSSFATSVHCTASALHTCGRRTSGVRPTRSRIESAASIGGSASAMSRRYPENPGAMRSSEYLRCGDRARRSFAVQRHEYSIELNAPREDVWEVFWYRAPDRPQPKDVKTRIEILHPGDE